MLKELAAALAGSAALRAWRERYCINNVEMMGEHEFAIHIMPFPPDTYDSVREEILGGKLEELKRELTEEGCSVWVGFEQCFFGSDMVFAIFVTPLQSVNPTENQ